MLMLSWGLLMILMEYDGGRGDDAGGGGKRSSYS